MRNFLKLARSHIHKVFSMLVFCRYAVVYIAIPQGIKGNCIDCKLYVYRCIVRHKNICFWGARSRIFIYIFFSSVGTFGGLPPPPPIPKSWLRYWVSVSFKRSAEFRVHCVVWVSVLSKIGWKGLTTYLTKIQFLRDYWTKSDGVSVKCK